MATTFLYYLLPGEDRDEYEALAAAYHQEFSPATEHELFLLNLLIEARWKILRFERLQAEAANQIFAAAGPVADANPDAALVTALSTATGAVWEKLARFRAQAERSYHRAHRELTQLRRQRHLDASASLDAQLDALINEPVPSLALHEQNEPNRAPAPPIRLATAPASAILDSSWHEPGPPSSWPQP